MVRVRVFTSPSTTPSQELTKRFSNAPTSLDAIEACRSAATARSAKRRAPARHLSHWFIVFLLYFVRFQKILLPATEGITSSLYMKSAFYMPVNLYGGST
jgi:hypothetical protein